MHDRVLAIIVWELHSMWWVPYIYIWTQTLILSHNGSLSHRILSLHYLVGLGFKAFRAREFRLCWQRKQKWEEINFNLKAFQSKNCDPKARKSHYITYIITCNNRTLPLLNHFSYPRRTGNNLIYRVLFIAITYLYHILVHTFLN